jgi:hypothetical protein
MGKVIASITTSVDGFITGPDDRPGCGLGKGGERLRDWVMGGPWTYDGGHKFRMRGPIRISTTSPWRASSAAVYRNNVSLGGEVAVALTR